MGNEIVLREVDKSSFQKALDYCKNWSETHQAEVGIAEMALGAGILSWGVMNGHISIGQDVLASSLAEIGGVTGMGVGATGASMVALTLLKGLFVGGVAGIAGVTAIPAIALIGGATAIFGAFGYVGGDLLEKVIDPPMGFGEFLGNASTLAIGAALMIDGARRIINDDRALELASSFKDGVIRLSSQATTVVARTKEEYDKLVKDFSENSEAKWITLAGAGSGTLLGTMLAGSTVTVLGSKALGAAALSLGLVSAPVWPVIAGAAAGLAIGVAAWKGVKHYTKKDPKPGLLPPPGDQGA
jgi:hypothetical protein